jgi:hypothetical protein
MGMNDTLFLPLFEEYEYNFLLNTDDSIKKIAWLGATGPEVVGPNTFKDVYHAAIQETKLNSLEMSYYDIDTSDGAKYWNINDSWENIKGYDLVVGWRVSPFCEDADHFSKQMSILLKNNKRVLFDFFIGGEIIIPSILPRFVRDTLSEKINHRVENFSSIFSWHDPISEEKIYKDFYIIPFFANLFSEHSSAIKEILGYDINNSFIYTDNGKRILTDKSLSNYGLRVSNKIHKFNLMDMYDTYSCRLEGSLGYEQHSHPRLYKKDWPYLLGGSLNPNLIKHFNKYFGAVSEVFYKNLNWFYPKSPLVKSEDVELPYKQAHLIVEFENING